MTILNFSTFAHSSSIQNFEIFAIHYYRDVKPFIIVIFCTTGSYQFCCRSVYCPACPMELNISTLGQNVTLNSALNFSCVNTSFTTTTFNTDRQPGYSAIEVSYYLLLCRKINLVNYNFRLDHLEMNLPNPVRFMDK